MKRNQMFLHGAKLTRQTLNPWSSILRTMRQTSFNCVLLCVLERPIISVAKRGHMLCKRLRDLQKSLFLDLRKSLEKNMPICWTLMCTSDLSKKHSWGSRSENRQGSVWRGQRCCQDVILCAFVLSPNFVVFSSCDLILYTCLPV